MLPLGAFLLFAVAQCKVALCIPIIAEFFLMDIVLFITHSTALAMVESSGLVLLVGFLFLTIVLLY